MITSPSVSALRTSRVSLAWESGLLRSSRSTSSSTSSPGPGKPLLPLLLHPSPPSDPSRQAGRLPIKVLKMLTARSGHILHPEYLQPLPSTPVSPIELDAKKSPLALLAQTCSQIGKPDPPPSSKLSSSSSGTSGDKESKTGPLKLSDIGVEDKSSFKPYSKPSDKKDAAAADNKSGFRVPSATCQPFTPRTGSPSSSASASSPMPSEGKCGDRDRDRDDKKDLDCHKSADPAGGHGRIGGGGITADQDSGCAPGPKNSCSSSDSSPPTSSSSSSVLGCSSGLVAPVSPYKPGQTVFPLPPAAMASYHGSLASAYHAGYPQHFLSPHGGSGGGLVHGGSLGCGSKAGSSPLAAASPPSLLCRDPYCLSYHCASHLAGAAAAAAASCSSHHDAAAAAAAVLKSQGYPLMYPAHALHASSLHAAASSLHAAPPPPPPSPFGGSGYPLYPYGFVLPNDPLPHVCNWVSANGPCDKRFSGSEELLNHLRTHTADKLMSGYPPGGGGSGSASSSLAAAMACHMHMPGSGGTLALRGPHLGLGGGGGGGGGRYHPYSKSPLPAPGGPVPVPAATGAYYSPYALYGQRLTTASALGYQ